MKMIHKFILFVGMMLLSLSNADAASISNPSFETFTSSVIPSSGIQLLPGTTNLTDWSVIGNEIAILTQPNNWGLTASDGDNFLDIAGYSNTWYPKGISQIVTELIVGQQYVITMDLGVSNDVNACWPCGGPIEVEASIGNIHQIFSHNSSDPGNIWMTYGFEFIANNTNMPLTIVGNSAPGIYIGLDNISVSAVPIPPAAWLLLSGVAVVFRFRQRRSV